MVHHFIALQCNEITCRAQEMWVVLATFKLYYQIHTGEMIVIQMFNQQLLLFFLRFEQQ